MRRPEIECYAETVYLCIKRHFDNEAVRLYAKVDVG